MTKTISKLAAELGVKADTIRYYERIGLLPEPDRTGGNYRLYGPSAAERLRFIKGGQRLGLRLDEIKQLLDIKDTGLCPCGHTASLLHKRIAALDEELERLSALRNELAGMIEHWPQEDGNPEGLRWHCEGEVIASPDRLSEWLCADRGACQPAKDVKSQFDEGR